MFFSVQFVVIETVKYFWKTHQNLKDVPDVMLRQLHFILLIKCSTI